jgi:CO dehydrogenase/acetyl-CoA synthase beta subunit
MAGKIQLKLKPKAAAPAAAAAAPAGAAAPAFAMPASGGSGGITIELRGASVHVAEVVIKPSASKPAAKK